MLLPSCQFMSWSTCVGDSAQKMEVTTFRKLLICLVAARELFLKHTSAWSLSPLHSGGTSSQCGTACHSDHWARDTEHLNHSRPSCDVLECEIHNALQWFNHNEKECRLSASCQEMASACSMHGAGRRSQCSGAAQRDGVGRAVGRFRMGDTCARGWFMSMYGKNHHNIVKELSSN